MADSISLDLELIDKVGGPAKRVADQLRRLEQQQQRTQAALKREQDRTQQSLEKSALGWAKLAQAVEKSKAREAAAAERTQAKTEKASQRAAVMAEKQAARTAAAVERATHRQAAAVEKAKAREQAAIRRTGLVQLQAQRMNEAHDKKKKGNTFFGGFGEKLGFRSIADYAKGDFFGGLAANAVTSIVSGFISGAKAAIGVITDGIKGAFREGGKAENLRLSYKLLLGNKGGEALSDIGRFSKQTTYDDDKIAEIMRPLFNAGLKGKGARSAFAASTDLEAAGLGDASGFVEQFAKIQLKGGVSEKMLLSMGISVRDFKDAIAKETHAKNKDAAFDAATSGKLNPQAIMNAIYVGIERRQGGKIGSGGEAASKTMSARLGKIEDLPSQYLKKASESPAWQKLSDKFGEALEALDPDGPRGQRIIASLFKAFDKLSTSIMNALTPENIDRFVAGVQRAVDLVGKLVEQVSTVAAWVADPSGQVAKSLHGGDEGDANVAMIERVRQSGMYRDEGLRDQIAKLTPSEKSDLIAAGRSGDFDYERFIAAGPDVVKAGASVTVKVENVNVTAPPGADAKATGTAVGEGLSATTIRQMERAARERGGK